jgi:hypothetical protein
MMQTQAHAFLGRMNGKTDLNPLLALARAIPPAQSWLHKTHSLAIKSTKKQQTSANNPTWLRTPTETTGNSAPPPNA